MSATRPPLAERVGRALPELTAAQRAELSPLLARAAELDDLPGKWQAAVLAAESGRAPSGGCGCGCA